jgi:hypothetical protein
MGVNLISDLSEVLSTFYKHVIVVDLDNSSWMLELGAKFSLLDGWIASIVTELNVDASYCYKWKQSKISTKIWSLQYQRYEGKKIKV